MFHVATYIYERASERVEVNVDACKRIAWQGREGRLANNLIGIHRLCWCCVAVDCLPARHELPSLLPTFRLPSAIGVGASKIGSVIKNITAKYRKLNGKGKQAEKSFSEILSLLTALGVVYLYSW